MKKLFKNYLFKRFLRGSISSALSMVLIMTDWSNPKSALAFLTSDNGLRLIVVSMICGILLTADKYLRSGRR